MLMRKLAACAMRGRVHAGALIAASALVGWVLPFLLPFASCVSGALVGLATLRQGVVEGLAVIALAVVMIAVFTVTGYGTPVPALVMGATMWLPVWLCAGVLRHTRDQGKSLVVAALLAALFAGGIRLATGDATAWWQALLEHALTATKQYGSSPSIGPGELEVAANLLNSMIAASMAVSLTLTVSIARWWQGLLYNPGGFGREFRALRLPKAVVLPAVAALLGITLATPAGELAGFLRDLCWVGAAILAFQGLALAHHRVNVTRSAGAWWLIGVYVLLLMLPQQMGLMLAAAGLADTLVDFRARSRGPA